MFNEREKLILQVLLKNTDEALSIKEIAKATKIKERTLYREIKNLESSLDQLGIDLTKEKSKYVLKGDLEAAQSQVSSMKAEAKGQEVSVGTDGETSYADVKRIIFACDAGMGSSAMGASILRNKVKKAGLDYEVTNVAIRNLTEEGGLLIVTQNELTPRAKQMNGKALHVSVDNFLNSPKYDEIVENLQK